MLVLKSTHFGILPLDIPLPASFKNECKPISDLKVICAQSCGHIEPLKGIHKFKNMLTTTLFLIPNDVKDPVSRTLLLPS